MIRYDTAPGIAHKDVLNHKGIKEKIILGKMDYYVRVHAMRTSRLAGLQLEVA